MSNSLRLLLALLGGLVIGLIAFVLFLKPSVKEITINGETVTVRVADNAAERYQGLSNVKEGEIGADGMMFVFSDAAPRIFEMREMKFALDFIWIKDGKVVKIDENIQPPTGKEDPIKVSSNPLSVDTVIEFPAGFAKKHDIFIGTMIE